MSSKNHGRDYDLVLFGATGYTGHYTAEHIVKSLPTNLRWALAGRSATKLAKVAAEIKSLNPDRPDPAIEICTTDDIASLAKRTFILITTVGPYQTHGEPVFKACAEAGTHYLDVTGEIPFVDLMAYRYGAAAKASGAMMFPQTGVDSAPSDLTVWEVTRLIRTEFGAPTRDVTAGNTFKATPSGGSLSTLFTSLDNASLLNLFRKSPVPTPPPMRAPASLWARLTGSVFVPALGQMTTSMMGALNASQVLRTSQLLPTVPGFQDAAYGPNFSFAEYSRVSTFMQALKTHLSIGIGMLLLLGVPPLRWLAKRLVTQPGSGASREGAKNDLLDYEVVGAPDVPAGEGRQPHQLAFCRAVYHGSMYELTGLIVAEAARTILADDLKLPGGVYTPVFLGQKFIDRLNEAGFKFESKLISAE